MIGPHTVSTAPDQCAPAGPAESVVPPSPALEPRREYAQECQHPNTKFLQHHGPPCSPPGPPRKPTVPTPPTSLPRSLAIARRTGLAHTGSTFETKRDDAFARQVHALHWIAERSCSSLGLLTWPPLSIRARCPRGVAAWLLLLVWRRVPSMWTWLLGKLLRKHYRCKRVHTDFGSTSRFGSHCFAVRAGNISAPLCFFHIISS